MDARFQLMTDEEIIGPVCDFTYSWCRNCGLNAVNALRFAVAVSELVTDVVLFAYPNERGRFDLEFRHSSRYVEVILSEVGEPFDPERHRYDSRAAAGEGDFTGAGFRLMERLSDRFIFINKGRGGKEFRLVREVDEQGRPIDRLLEEPALSQPRLEDVEKAPSDEPLEYRISRIEPEDAEEIAKVIYRTYGYTYSKDEIYFPRRIEQAVSERERLGVIAKTPEGEAIGYFAVLKGEDSRIAEVGEAAVTPVYRRRGVMTRMMEELVRIARERGLSALFGKAVTLHKASQIVNARAGFHSVALMLAYNSDVVYRGIEEEFPQPVSVVIDYLPLDLTGSGAIYPPERYRDQILESYRLLGMEIRPEEPHRPQLAASTDLDLNIDYARRTAQITVWRYGPDFLIVLQEMILSLEEQNLISIFLDLPLQLEPMPEWYSGLQTAGFIYCGLLPGFRRGIDFLRLQKVHASLDLSLINIYSEAGKRIKELVGREYHESAERIAHPL